MKLSTKVGITPSGTIGALNPPVLQTSYGDTGLTLAIRMRAVEVALLLIEKAPGLVNVAAQDHDSPLILACKTGQSRIVSGILRTRNAHLNYQSGDGTGNTALMSVRAPRPTRLLLMHPQNRCVCHQ